MISVNQLNNTHIFEIIHAISSSNSPASLERDKPVKNCVLFIVSSIDVGAFRMEALARLAYPSLDTLRYFAIRFFKRG